MPEWLRDPVGYYRWDRLRHLGNLGIMKMTVLMPLIGYIIIFNASLHEHLRLTFDPDGGGTPRLYLIYFGVTFLGIGSIIFQLACPPEVKQHGSAWEFVAKEGEFINRHRLRLYREHLFKPRYDRFLAELPEEFRGDLQVVRGKYQQAILNPQKSAAEQQLVRIATRHLDTLEHDLERWQQAKEVMTDYFVPLKGARPGWRMAVLASFVIGFLFLAYPTVHVFLRVCLHFVQFICAA